MSTLVFKVWDVNRLLKRSIILEDKGDGQLYNNLVLKGLIFLSIPT